MSFKDCDQCEGKGYTAGYSGRGVCQWCKGTGKDISLEDQRLMDLVERLLETRHRVGWE